MSYFNFFLKIPYYCVVPVYICASSSLEKSLIRYTLEIHLLYHYSWESTGNLDGLRIALVHRHEFTVYLLLSHLPFQFI